MSLFISLSSDAYAAVNSVRPNGDGTINAGWVTSGGASTGLSGEIDDDPDTPNDLDYVKTANQTSNASYFQLDDLPVNFAGATSVEIKARHREAGAGNDLTALTYSIVQSNEATAITSSSTINLPENATYQTDTMTLSVTGTNTKTVWDGARLKIALAITGNKGPDDAPANISAVEVNVTYSPLVTLEQSSYRLFANSDSTNVGLPLANQNTGATLASAGQAFRLRTNIHVNDASLGISGKSFKLQYAGKGAGTCAVPGGSPANYTDVTTSTTIAFNNNPTPADGAALASNASDPTHSSDTAVRQTYEEANNFTNSVAGILAGQDGMWDFALKDNGAAAGASYCFRIVESTNTTLYGYTVYPEITTSPPSITQRAYIFEQDDGATVNSNTDHGTANSALTGVNIGERLEVRIQLDYTDATSLTGDLYQLYFDQNDGNFVQVAPGKAIQPTTGLSGKTGDALTATAAGACTSGRTFVNGTWHENTATSRRVNLSQNNCTELGFMIDTSRTNPGTTYRLQLRRNGATLASYAQYPTLTTIASATNTIRASKDSTVRLPSCTHSDWGCETVDSSVDAGSLWSSMTIDQNGDPWMSYYDATNTDLKVAHYVGSGGNCTSTKWSCERIDISSGAVGSNTSIGIDTFGYTWVSYRNAVNGALKIATTRPDAGIAACSAIGWYCVDVDTSGSNMGFESAIAFDKSGNPYVTYNDTGNSAIRVSWYVGSGGNCTSSLFSCGELDALGSNGLDGDWTSIKFDSNNNAWVSYYDGTNSALKVATTSTSAFTGAAPCTLSGWKCGIADNTAAVGELTSLAINPIDGAPWIVYDDATNQNLKITKFVGSGGNCTSAAWQCETVATRGGVQPDPSLEFDPAGTPWFTYFTTPISGGTATSRSLHIARYVGSSGGSGCSNTNWTCQDVDFQTDNTGEYGHGKALEFDASGTAWVAYRDNTNSSMKIAKTNRPHYYNPLKYELDDAGYTAIGSVNSSYDQISGTAHDTMYRFTSVNGSNTGTITPTWVGKSTVAASTNAIHMQVYRFGTTNAWQEIATNSTCTANNICTISPVAISTNLGEYYQSEGSNYLLHFRVYQDSGTTKTLSTDNFTLASQSSNSSPATPSSLAQAKVTGGASVAIGGWTNESQIRLSATASDPDTTDTLRLCVERQPLGTPFVNSGSSGTGEICGTAVPYSGSTLTASVDVTGLSEGQYHWQARIKDTAGSASAWVSAGLPNLETDSDFGVDTTKPTGSIYDGSTKGVDATYNSGTLNSLQANWAVDSSISGIARLETAFGTTPGATDISPRTNISLTQTASYAGGMILKTSQMYYATLWVTDNAGNTETFISNGLMVAPTLTFSASTNTVNLGNLNASNSYTASQTLTLTTSTNALNGYKVYGKATDFLKSQSLDIVPMFNGGSYASPATWGSSTGFGYNSSDTLVGGTNRFNSATCPGGGSAPCFAPYATSGNGDVVADTTAPATNDAVTITNKATINSTTQQAGKYQTTVLYSVYATY